jgi:hypothetical protein
MKKNAILLSFFLTLSLVSFGQVKNDFVGTCVDNVGPDSKYLKDYRVQLGKPSAEGDLRYKANISLWKSTKYRFTMCNAEDSRGKLIVKIKDEANQTILSSFDQKTGKTYTYIDFICSKSGIYQLSYDFVNEPQGSGLGVISVVR